MVLQGLQASSSPSPSSPSLSLSLSRVSPSTKHPVHCPGLGSFRTEGPVSPTWDRSLSLPRKSIVREPVSPRENALGDRSHLPGTGCLADSRNTAPRGPVSPIRERSPKVGIPSTTFHQVWKTSESISNTRTSQFA
uniref:Uncharacterized protein n=1 Tax=Ananas comosus var. bracteatus TaxID=296719 RepID=A0A6V7NJH9_ANACO|nr:unnamed protein product [Ananas comosus var. bracteatus]